MHAAAIFARGPAVGVAGSGHRTRTHAVAAGFWTPNSSAGVPRRQFHSCFWCDLSTNQRPARLAQHGRPGGSRAERGAMKMWLSLTTRSPSVSGIGPPVKRFLMRGDGNNGHGLQAASATSLCSESSRGTASHTGRFQRILISTRISTGGERRMSCAAHWKQMRPFSPCQIATDSASVYAYD